MAPSLLPGSCPPLSSDNTSTDSAVEVAQSDSHEKIRPGLKLCKFIIVYISHCTVDVTVEGLTFSRKKCLQTRSAQTSTISDVCVCGGMGGGVDR